MFDVENDLISNAKPEHIACPKQEALPSPLMDDYLKILQSPNEHKLWLEKSSKDYDSYAYTNSSGTEAKVEVHKGSNPKDPSEIVSIGTGEDYFFERKEYYDNGSRTFAKFNSKSSDENNNIEIEAKIDQSNGTIRSEHGEVNDVKDTFHHKYSFDAEFSDNGKLITFSAQTGRTSQNTCDESVGRKF